MLGVARHALVVKKHRMVTRVSTAPACFAGRQARARVLIRYFHGDLSCSWQCLPARLAGCLYGPSAAGAVSEVDYCTTLKVRSKVQAATSYVVVRLSFGWGPMLVGGSPHGICSTPTEEGG